MTAGWTDILPLCIQAKAPFSHKNINVYAPSLSLSLMLFTLIYISIPTMWRPSKNKTVTQVTTRTLKNPALKIDSILNSITDHGKPAGEVRNQEKSLICSLKYLN